MKTLKYFVAFLSAALMFSACEPEQGLSQQNKDKEKPTVSLLLKSANDVTLSFDLVASDNAAQYAYAVFPGSDNEAPSAYDILLQETFAAADGAYNTKLGDDASPKASVTIDCTDFAAETYQIFAAAITETGLVGEVSVLDVTMDDTIKPEYIGANADKNVFMLAFSENVVRGKGKVYASVFALGVYGFYLMDEPVPEENITVEGNIATIVCPEAPAGAVYMVSYEDGLVTDLAGNKCAGEKSGLTNEGPFGWYWTTEFESIPILDSYFETPAEDTDWGAEDASITFKFPVQVMDAGMPNPIQVVYAEDEGTSQLNARYVLADDAQTVTVYLPKMPTGAFDIQVAAEAFYDIWGNGNAAYTPTEYRYSNYLVSLAQGNYLVNYFYPDQNGNPVLDQFPLYFELVDRTTAIIYPDWFNFTYRNFGETGYVCMPYLVGTVDYKNQTVTFDGRYLDDNGNLNLGAYATAYYWYDSAKTQLLVFWSGGDSGQDPVVMTFNGEGYLDTMSYCDYSIHNAETGGFIDIFGCTAVTETGNAEVTYVPSEQQTVKMTNAPRKSHPRQVSVKANFTK